MMNEAALASITALQKQIKILELENENLEAEYNSLQRQISIQNSQYEKREDTLTAANQHAKSILQNVKDTLRSVKAVRDENEKLKQELDQSEQLLEIQKRKKLKLKQEVQETTAELSDLQAAVREQERMLAELCEPPAAVTTLSPEEALILVSNELPENLLTQQQQRIHRRLKKLPKVFSTQDMKTKNDIIRTMIAAKSISQDLISRIRLLEKRKYASSTPKDFESDVKTLASQQIVLTEDMKQFKI